MTLRENIDKILEKFVAALMAILVVDVLWQVISRYVLSAPSSFTDELAGFLLIWVGLFGSAYVAGKNEHLAIDLLVQRSGPAQTEVSGDFHQSVHYHILIDCTGGWGLMAGLYQVCARREVCCSGNPTGICLHRSTDFWFVDHVFYRR
jgi:hypothetical protein